MKKLALIAAALASATALLPVAASAAVLTGSTVTLTPVFANGDIRPDQTATVGAGVEFPVIPNYGGVVIDVGADYVDFAIRPTTSFNSGAFNGFLFSFSGLTLSSPTLISGPSPVSFFVNSDNQLAVNFAGQSSAGATTRIGITAEPTLAAVPEPATWSLMLLGFGMVGAGLRTRRRSVTFANA